MEKVSGVGSLLTEQLIGSLFPNKVLSHAVDHVERVPRDGVRFQISRKGDMNVWQFSGISIQAEEAAYLGLPPFSLAVDYFSGPEDWKFLFQLIKVVGKPKDSQGFELFINPVLTGEFGIDYPDDYNKDLNRFRLTSQLALLQKVLEESQKPVLMLAGHGGFSSNDKGYVEKTIGTRDALGIPLSKYLQNKELSTYSAVIDHSCTVVPKFCMTTLPSLLPENSPPFFGSLGEVDRGLGMKACDSYCVKDREAIVFRKQK